MTQYIAAQLTGKSPEPILNSDGETSHYIFLAEGDGSFQFIATPRQSEILSPLIETGSSQVIILRRDPASEGYVLIGAKDPLLRATMARVVRPVRSKYESIDDRARTIFDATPSAHPSSRLLDWTFQPESIKKIFRGFAARLPYAFDPLNPIAPDTPQIALRKIANDLWARNRTRDAIGIAHILWEAASVLDLDQEASEILGEESYRIRLRFFIEEFETVILNSDEIIQIKSIMVRLVEITDNAGSLQAKLPFAAAHDLISIALRISGVPRVPFSRSLLFEISLKNQSPDFTPDLPKIFQGK